MRNRYWRCSSSRNGATVPLTRIVSPKNSGTHDTGGSGTPPGPSAQRAGSYTCGYHRSPGREPGIVENHVGSLTAIAAMLSTKILSWNTRYFVRVSRGPGTLCTPVIVKVL